MSNRIFTQEELDSFCRSGKTRVAEALATKDPKIALKEFELVLDLFKQFPALYHGWIPSLFSFLDKRYGHEATKGLTNFEHVLSKSAASGMDLKAISATQEDPTKVFSEKLDKGDFEGAGLFFDQIDKGSRDLHDYYRDYVSYILSGIYREYGVEILSESLRASSEKDWMPWMMEDIESEPSARLIMWSELLSVANFGTISIVEEDDRFVMTQNPCGSCGRAHREGRYDSDWGLATVKEKHPITYDEGGTPVYRSHIPMMHFIMPVERIGAPWPLIQCPRTKAGSCKITLFKDSRKPVPQTEAHFRD